MVHVYRRLRTLFILGVLTVGLLTSYFLSVQQRAFSDGIKQDEKERSLLRHQISSVESDDVNQNNANFLEVGRNKPGSHMLVHNFGLKSDELLDYPATVLASKKSRNTSSIDETKPARRLDWTGKEKFEAKKETAEKSLLVTEESHTQKVQGNHPTQYIKNLHQSMPRRYLKDRKGLELYEQYLKEFEESLPEQRRAVIILTNHRSGSSFFGELFNQHPDVFYLFEPLFPLSNSSLCELHLPQKIQALKDLVKCNLPDWAEVYKGIPEEEHIKKNNNMKNCLIKGVCFRQNTKELCNERHCPRIISSSVKNCDRDCGVINRRLANNECRKKRMIALKIIRLCDIMDLKEIISSLPVDTKILHLLRDPRGIANSRQLVMKRLDIKKSILGTCNRQAHNLVSGVVNPPEWLKGRYKVFRYEDIALYPYDVARSVYDFVGLSFPEEMKRWIENNTNIKIPLDILSVSTPSVNKIDDGQMKNLLSEDIIRKSENKRHPRNSKFSNPYGTARDSAKIVQKWASRLPYTTVKTIELVCSNIMTMAGYISVGDPDQYKNNKTMKYFDDNIPVLNQR